MPEYLAPGVYVEEIPSTNKPIQAASTSTAGMVGMTARGPVGRPTLVTSLGDYARTFGGRLNPLAFTDHRYALPFAAEGFFANGGSRLYVVRVVGPDAHCAELSLVRRAASGTADSVVAVTVAISQNTVVVHGPEPLKDGDTVLFVYGASGQEVEVAVEPGSVRFVVGDGLRNAFTADATARGQNITASRLLDAAATAGNTVLVPMDINGLSANDVVLVHDQHDPQTGEIAEISTVVEATAANGTLPAQPAHVTLAMPLRRDHARHQTLSKLTSVDGDAPTLDADAAAETGPVELSIANPGSIAAGTVLLLEKDDTKEYVLVTAVSSTLTLAKSATEAIPSGTTVVLVAKGPTVHASSEGTWGNALRVTSLPSSLYEGTAASAAAEDDVLLHLSTVVGLYPGSVLVVEDTGEAVYVIAVDADAGTATLAEGLQDPVAAEAVLHSQEFSLVVDRVEFGREVETERFDGLSLAELHPRFAPNIVGKWVNDAPAAAGASALIRISTLAEPTISDLVKPLLSGVPRFFAGGGDDVDGVTDTAYIGRDAQGHLGRTGIKALEDEPTLSLVAVPGRTSVTVQKALITHCDRLRYRFAVLDVPADSTLDGARAHRQNFDSTRAAVYYPDVQIADPYGAPGELLGLPPSGHVLGIYARTDTTRGVHKAPANEVVSDVLSLTRALTKGEHDMANPRNLNVLRDFRSENRGIRVYGARVACSDPEWRYVNVRRLLLFIEQSLDVGLQWAVFEPNDTPLWDAVRQSAVGFLDTVWRSGALEGTQQEQAFFVNIGYGVTMTQADIDNGLLVVEVGVAPVKPAEFVVVRISQKTRDAIA